MCYATCLQLNCSNITDTGVFHEIIINVMFVRLQKEFLFFENSLQGSLDIMLFCICRSRLFHTCSEQRYCSAKEGKRIKFIISFLKIIQKKNPSQKHSSCKLKPKLRFSLEPELICLLALLKPRTTKISCIGRLLFYLTREIQIFLLL